MPLSLYLAQVGLRYVEVIVNLEVVVHLCGFVAVNLRKQLARYPFPNVDSQTRPVNVIVIDDYLPILANLRVVPTVIGYL